MAYQTILKKFCIASIIFWDANAASSASTRNIAPLPRSALTAFVEPQKRSEPLSRSLPLSSPSLYLSLKASRRHLITEKVNDEEIEPHANQNRRQWMEETTRWGVNAAVATSSTASFLQPRAALAATAAILNPTAVASKSSALCDPSVSTLTKKNRIVHILGTAHISSDSAQLAGRLVREVTPKAVFLELDQKRVTRALPTSETATSSSGPSTERMVSDGGGQGRSSGQVMENTPPTEAMLTTGPGAETTQPKKTNPFNLKEKVLQASSELLGNSIKSLYRKLESDGFSAGEEFSIAAQEGLALGSTIVLGDQDVEITLRRLTEALSKTDIKKLLAADSELEQNMKGLLPEGVALASSPGVASSGAGVDDPELSKEQFASFIEVMKAKENVRLLMGNLKAVAPEIYNAMVGERDEYMASGLDKLNQFESTVAVMGIAHVDGVERYLKANGWVEVPASCPLRS